MIARAAEKTALREIRRAFLQPSGKGGVGKSLVTSLLATEAARKGQKVGILDADITGPSIPHIFGIEGQTVTGSDDGLIPASTKTGRGSR